MSTTIQVQGGQTYRVPQDLTEQEAINTYSPFIPGLANMSCTASTDNDGNAVYLFAPQTGRKGA